MKIFEHTEQSKVLNLVEIRVKSIGFKFMIFGFLFSDFGMSWYNSGSKICSCLISMSVQSCDGSSLISGSSSFNIMLENNF
jgi:hypothetical protein